MRLRTGENLSIEFTGGAPDDDQPRLGTWLERRAADPAAVMRSVLDAGLTQVIHPGHPYYLMAPGGQVFIIAQPVEAPGGRARTGITEETRVAAGSVPARFAMPT